MNINTEQEYREHQLKHLEELDKTQMNKQQLDFITNETKRIKWLFK